jgi:DNA-binding protein Fis
MLKIGKQNRNDSVKRAIDIAGQNCDTCNQTDQANSLVNQIEWNQMHDSQMYEIEAEQKRALAIMYARRNTIR